MNLFSDIRALVIDSLTAMVAEGALPAGDAAPVLPHLSEPSVQARARAVRASKSE